MLGEIALGGRLDAVESIAEINFIEVQPEDLVLAVFRFDPAGQNQLLQLVPERLVRF